MALILICPLLSYGVEGDFPTKASGGGYSQTLIWGFLFLFLILSALFSGSETALFSLDRMQLSQIEKRHPHGYHYIRSLLLSPQKTLTSILFLNCFVNISASLAAGALARSYMTGSPVLSFVAGAAGVTLLILICGEIMPKTLAIERSNVIALFCAPILILFCRLILPIRIIIDLFKDGLFRILRFTPVPSSDTTTEEDLKMMLISGELDGLLEEDEREMIDGVFEFGEKTVEEIMTPRTELEAYSNMLTQQELIDVIRKGNHSRVLIFEEDIDHIVGVLHVKDLLLNPNRRYVELIREPHFVPPKKELTTLLKEMQRSRSHIAIVGDEFGGTAGIVTLNNLLEEIVGDIRDAGEAARETKEIIRISPGHYNLAGKTEVTELNEALGLDLDVEVARTLGGYVFNILGRLPEEGEEFRNAGWLFQVKKMDGNRIDRIRLKKLKKEVPSRGDQEDKP